MLGLLQKLNVANTGNEGRLYAKHPSQAFVFEAVQPLSLSYNKAKRAQTVQQMVLNQSLVQLKFPDRCYASVLPHRGQGRTSCLCHAYASENDSPRRTISAENSAHVLHFRLGRNILAPWRANVAGAVHRHQLKLAPGAVP